MFRRALSLKRFAEYLNARADALQARADALAQERLDL